MKDIGFTKDGYRIVEMKEEEYTQLARLTMAVEGKEFPSFPNPNAYALHGYDLTKTFEVIRAYYETRFHINVLRMQIESISESLNKI